MGSLISFRRQMFQICIILIFAINFIDFQVVTTTASIQNNVIENLRILSQRDDNGLQPSRLRTLLVTDLQNILVKNVSIYTTYICSYECEFVLRPMNVFIIVLCQFEKRIIIKLIVLRLYSCR